MCEFSCDTCSPPLGFGSVKYDCWVDHLISENHQVEVKKKLDPRKRWRDEKESYVLTWTVSEVPWSLRELAEWLSVFGVVTELMYYPNYGFCVFTLQGFGALGLEKVKSISNQKELRGRQIVIKPKKRFRPQDWDIVYNTDTGNSHSTANNSDAVPVASSSSSFTNQNKSSNNNNRQQTPISANTSVKAQSSQESISSSLSSHNASRSNSSTAINAADKKTSVLDKDSQSDGKANKKRKSTERKKLNEQKVGDSVTIKQILNASSNSNPKIAVPPSSLAPKNVPPKTEDFPPLSPSKPQQQQEPLNFRGGFTPSGRRDREYRMSESNDGNHRVEQQQQQQVTTPSSSATVQILQRTVVNEGQGPSSQRQKQAHTGNANKTPNQHRQNYPVRNHQGNESYPPLPPQNMRQYHQQQPPQHNYIISPIFTCQVSPIILPMLSNPTIPKARNPYRFDVTPPFPYFFDLFHKLTEESFKPQKEILYKQFQALPLQQQLDEFFAALALPCDEIRLRWQVILDILVILRQQYPRCELFAFGSILTGLGDFSSDIDLYVDLTGDSTSSKPTNSSHKLSGHEAVDLVKKILRKSQCPHTKNRFVQHLIPVKSARVPILKMTHQTTKINCDLSFENRLSVQNTKLLSFYLNLDVRIFRFMVLIRYWGKFHHLTGSNHIKNYALNLLVLVYLTRKGYVPSIEHLQRLKAAERKQNRVTFNPDEIEGWDSSFCDNISVIRQNFQAVPLPSSSPMDNKNNNYASQTQTLIQMAIEFFEMFANLDFSQVVVCPLIGDILPKENFCAGSEESLPNALDRYKNWAVKQPMNRRLNVKSQLCVQDPFVLSFNVGSVTPQGTLLRFQIACAKSAQILSQQKSGLKSLLDVLTRLPGHIGEKKFMRAYKTERMSQDLKREIKRAVVNMDGAVAEEIPQVPLAQKSSYVTLPGHLRAFDKLIDEKALKQESKRPRWENFLDFNVNSQLETIFVTEVTRFGYAQTTKRLILMDNLRTLWHQFSMDFIRDFFEIGLKLNTVQSKEMTVDADDPETNGAEAKGEDGGGGKQRWKMYLLNVKEEEKVMAMGGKSAEEVSKFTKNIKALPSIPGQLNYKVVTYRVTYPFWERRPLFLSKVAREIKVSEMVQIPVAPTTNKTKSKDKNGRGKKSKENKNDKSAEKKNGHWNCFDPIDLEAKVSENIWKGREEFKNFKEFQFNVLIKLDLSTTDDKPEMFLVFEKDLSLNCNSTDYFRAIQCVANILTEAFPRYQIFRLAKWLDLPPPSSSGALPNIETEVASSSTALSKENTALDKQAAKEDAGMEETDAGEKNKEKKKKTRTKLEEELLIPSSSSSTCSDEDVNENNGLEELSEDDDDDDDQNDASEQSEEESNERNSAIEEEGGEETKENKSSSST